MRKPIPFLFIAATLVLTGCSIEGTRILNLSGKPIEFQFRLDTDTEWSDIKPVEAGESEMFGWGKLAENLQDLRFIEDGQSYRLSRDSVRRVRSYCATSWLKSRFEPHVCYFRYYGQGRYVLRNLVADRDEGPNA